jgi:CRISPR-associated protein Cas1
MMPPKIPWFLVSGFGAHIKSTPSKLIVVQKNRTREFPIDSINHLLIVGGHTLHTSTIIHLLKKGVYLSIFEADGTPVSTIRPYGSGVSAMMRELQAEAPRHRYAVALVGGSIKSRLLFLQRLEESLGLSLLYKGENEIIHKSLEELEYLIRLEEIRRVHRLTSDMYYEILSRAIPPELGYRRRRLESQQDVVNAMFSIGYSMLYGNCLVAILGAHMDPDIGILREGQAGLVYDLFDPLKARMIDETVVRVAAERISPDDFEISGNRCILSDELVRRLINLFKTSIRVGEIDEQVCSLVHALQDHEEFRILC